MTHIHLCPPGGHEGEGLMAPEEAHQETAPEVTPEGL